MPCSHCGIDYDNLPEKKYEITFRPSWEMWFQCPTLLQLIDEQEPFLSRARGSFLMYFTHKYILDRCIFVNNNARLKRYNLYQLRDLGEKSVL